MLRRPFLFGVIFSFVFFGSLHAEAGDAASAPARIYAAADLTWQALADDEKAIIDRMAADFFEASLRLSQSRLIEAHTGKIYRSLTPADRAYFREERRRAWKKMTAAQRLALRGVKRPKFSNLAEPQKQPFRRYALDILGAEGAINQQALADVLAQDI